MKTLTDVMNMLPKERCVNIKTRAETLIAEEMSLQDLSNARDQNDPTELVQQAAAQVRNLS